MATFSTPLRGQQELTLLGSEKTTSSLVVFISASVSTKGKTYKTLQRKNERCRTNEKPRHSAGFLVLCPPLSRAVFGVGDQVVDDPAQGNGHPGHGDAEDGGQDHGEGHAKA